MLLGVVGNYQGAIHSKNPRAEMRTKNSENLLHVIMTGSFSKPGNSQAKPFRASDRNIQIKTSVQHIRVI